MNRMTFLHFILVAVVLIGGVEQIVSSNNENSESVIWPEPHSTFNKVLGMILVFNFKRIDSIMVILNEYKSLCESGWKPTIAFFTTEKPSYLLSQYFAEKLYCYYTQQPIPIIWQTYNTSVGIYIADKTREFVANEASNFDLFMYHEEDIILQQSHVMAYLHETKRLAEVVGYEASRDYMIGFQRYRRHNRPFKHLNDLFSDHDIFHQEYLEETPFFKPVCVKDQPYLQISNGFTPNSNPHQAIWILTKAQLMVLDQKCQFFNQTVIGTKYHRYTREYMSSLSIFENEIVPLNCGIKKVLPAERLMTFSILHYYTSFDPNFPKLNSHPVFIVDQHIKHGYMQMKHPVLKAGYFHYEGVSSCWGRVLSKYEQMFTTKPEDMDVMTTGDSNIIKHSADNISPTSSHLSTDAIHLLKQEDTAVLAKQKGTIYLIEKGKRHMIPSRKVFEDRGFNWDKVIASAEIEGFDELPLGQVVTGG